MSGIIFKGGLPSDCTCPICDQALREPFRLNCDHFYCKLCLDTCAAQGNLNCAICQSLIDPGTCKYDKEKHKEIQNLPVVCSFESSGCPWQGQLGQLSEHLTRCPKKVGTCPNCGRTFTPQDMEKHQQKCMKNRAVCTFCGKMVRESDMERHMKSCSKVIISCPFQCGLVDKSRAEIELHRPNCPNVDNVCPFVPLGCTFAGGKEAVQKHLSEEPVKHLMFLCDEITDLKVTYDMMERDMETFNDRQTLIIENSETCAAMFGPQLVWKIDNIQQRTNEAKSGAITTIFSEPFMSHRYGYKMMACACLFGDGSSAGKSLSLYVLILKGEYDATLTWPFNRSVKIKLLDQNPNPEDRVNITYVIDPRKLRANEKFLARPRGERNAAFGSQSFCTLEILQTYIKSDIFYVQVEVDRCETMDSISFTRDEEKKKLMDNFRSEARTPDGRPTPMPSELEVPARVVQRPLTASRAIVIPVKQATEENV